MFKNMTEQVHIDDQTAAAPAVDSEYVAPTLQKETSTTVGDGYRVEMLSEGSETPVPAKEALLLDPAERAKQFSEAFVQGNIRTTIVQDAWTPSGDGKTPGFVLFHQIPQARVEVAGIPLDIFEDNKLQRLGASAREEVVNTGDLDAIAKFDKKSAYANSLDALLTSEEKQEQVATYYGKQADRVERLYKDDLAGVEQREVGLEKLHQAFELNDTVEGAPAGNVRVLNFTETPLTSEHMAHLSDKLGKYAKRSGGAIFDNFDSVVFVPKDHPSLKVTVRGPDGTAKEMTRRGYMAPRVLVMSEWIMYPPDQQPPATAESTAVFHSYLHEGESAEGPDAPVRTVAQGRFEGTVAHEFAHMALVRDDMPKTRSLYSRFNEVEHDAELTAAQTLGEEHLVPATQDEKDKLEGKWQWLRMKAKRDGRPQGDHFVDAKEYDLSAGPLPLRPKKPGQALPTEITYKVVPPEAA